MILNILNQDIQTPECPPPNCLRGISIVPPPLCGTDSGGGQVGATREWERIVGLGPIGSTIISTFLE